VKKEAGQVVAGGSQDASVLLGKDKGLTSGSVVCNHFGSEAPYLVHAVHTGHQISEVFPRTQKSLHFLVGQDARSQLEKGVPVAISVDTLSHCEAASRHVLSVATNRPATPRT
jgi:hypothetical protein